MTQPNGVESQSLLKYISVCTLRWGVFPISCVFIVDLVICILYFPTIYQPMEERNPCFLGYKCSMYSHLQAFHVFSDTSVPCILICKRSMFSQIQVFHVFSLTSVSCNLIYKCSMYSHLQVFHVFSFTNVPCFSDTSVPCFLRYR